MKTVTLTDLRRNLESYLDEAQNGDIVITRYGKVVARLISTANENQNENSDASESDTDAATSVA